MEELATLNTALKPTRKRVREIGMVIRDGIVVQPRFPRPLHERIKVAAAEDHLHISRWILECCLRELERRKRRAKKSDN